jgi:hypothetical protein
MTVKGFDMYICKIMLIMLKNTDVLIKTLHKQFISDRVCISGYNTAAHGVNGTYRVVILITTL